jgi:Uma2 family endonuclease
MNWASVIKDSSLNDLPYKIETNELGQLVMSPAARKHGRLQSIITVWLETHLQGGYTVNEAPIETSKGVRVPDVVWATVAHYESETEDAFLKAPSICVEIRSPSNSAVEFREKTMLYLASGALEVWICNEDGQMQFFDATGQLERSKLAPEFPLELMPRRP